MQMENDDYDNKLLSFNITLFGIVGFLLVALSIYMLVTL
jgi:hypothetical protein